METTIKSTENNPLFDRAELELEINHEGEATPSKEDIAGRLSAERNLDKDDIQVESIYTGFGRNISVAEVKVAEQLELEEEIDEKSAREEPETEEGTEETEEQGEESQDVDYEEIVSGTISDAKDALKELEEPDYKAALEAEKQNKNRTTFTDWLETRTE